MKLAYLGPRGTFSEQAAVAYQKKIAKQAKLIPYNTIFDVLMAVKSGEVQLGIVPIENSVEGGISITLDILARKDTKLFISQELDLEIKHDLLVLSGVKRKDIKVIYSHPQPLAQCQEYLHRKFPKAVIAPTDSTAAAVKKIKEDDLRQHAAIGSAYLAELEEMQVLDKDIAQHKDNVTRFVVVSRQVSEPSSHAKTSFVFSCKKDRPGGLYEILGFLAKRKINMTKIESRPSKSVLGDYLFFIDLDGSVQNKSLAEALKDIRKHSSFYKYLGSYQRSLEKC